MVFGLIVIPIVTDILFKMMLCFEFDPEDETLTNRFQVQVK